MSEATPVEGNTPAGDGTLRPIPPNSEETTATLCEMPIPNPFGNVAGAAPLEAELRNLAARNSGVQLTEIHQVHVGTPTPLPLTIHTGSQEQEDRLACIGMAVRVTRTVEATGVPVSGAPATDMKHAPTQTVTTHREARGVIVGVLDNLPPDGPPEQQKAYDLYEINTDFSEDLLRDGGGEALAELVETYSSTLCSSLDFHDVPEIELDCNYLELDEGDSDSEGESGEPTSVTKDSEPTNPPDADGAGVSGEWGEPLPCQPGFRMGETEIEIQGVGVF